MIDDPKRRGLGRGLAALMGEPAPGSDAAAARTAAATGVREIPIEQLKPNPYQPRKVFNKEALEELAQSIRAKGVLQPLLVRRAKDGQGPGGTMYEIIAGERRWRAAQLAKIHAVPVVIKEITDRDAVEIGLIENLQREDLNPVEEAGAFLQLSEEFGYSQDQIAQVIGKSRSHVTNILRLLQLPKPVIMLVITGKLTAGQARPLIGHPLAEQLAQRIIEGRLTAREVEKLVAVGRAVGSPATAKKGGRPAGSAAKPKTAAASAGKDADTLAFERGLAAALGMKVEIEAEPGNPEAGRLVVHYRKLEQLDELAKKLSR